MNTIDEAILKASQTADLLDSDLTAIIREINRIVPPQGMSRGDKALHLVIVQSRAAIDKIRSDLAHLL